MVDSWGGWVWRAANAGAVEFPATADDPVLGAAEAPFVYISIGVAAAAVVILAGAWAWRYYSQRRTRKRRAVEGLKHARAHTTEVERVFREWLLPTILIIDSNIWMNEEPGYEAFFAVLMAELRRGKRHLLLYGPQFDEIANILRESGPQDERRRQASLAIKRIESFQKHRLLRIEAIEAGAREDAHADVFIVDILRSHIERGNPVSFVTDDQELRVRTRELLQQAVDRHGPVTYSIVEGDWLAELCPYYCREHGVRYDEKSTWIKTAPAAV